MGSRSAAAGGVRARPRVAVLRRPGANPSGSFYLAVGIDFPRAQLSAVVAALERASREEAR